MRLVFILLSIFILPGAFIDFCETGLIFAGDTRLLLTVLSGFFAGIVMWFVILRQWNWMGTFGHELAHAVVALSFFRKITGFKVTASKGGYVKYKGSSGGTFGDIMITLAPYYLPTWTLVAIAFCPWVSEGFQKWYMVILGFTLAWHLFGNFKELRENWASPSAGSDIRKSGFATALVIVITLNLLFYPFFFRILLPYQHVLPDFPIKIFRESISAWVSLFRLI